MKRLLVALLVMLVVLVAIMAFRASTLQSRQPGPADPVRIQLDVSPNAYRFLPVLIGQGALQLAHGTNERIWIESLGLAVRYMIQLIRNADGLN